MKYLNKSIFILLVSLFIVPFLANAVAKNISDVVVSDTLKYGVQYQTGVYQKDDWDIQTYKTTGANTTLNTPCESCQFLIELYTESGTKEAGVISALNLTHQLEPSLTSTPDNFYLRYRRFDFTLLKTYHIGVWHIQQPKTA